MVTFAGSSGAGKACLAAEVVGRRDVRAKFGDGVLWLQVEVFVGGEGGIKVSACLGSLVVRGRRPRLQVEVFGGGVVN